MEGSSESLRRQEQSLAEGKSSSGPGYLKASTVIVSIALGVLLTGVFAFLFFRSLYGLAVTWPAGVIVAVAYIRNAKEKHEQKLAREVRDALMATENSLRAGAAFENALAAAAVELERMWGHGELLPAWQQMNRRIALREPAEEAFLNMAEQLGQRELMELAGLLKTAKKSGGGLSELLRFFGNQMAERIAVEGEIAGRLTERRMEKNIMLAMPPGIILYLQVSSYDWIAMLYETWQGRGFMTGCLIIYAVAYMLGEKMLKITV